MSYYFYQVLLVLFLFVLLIPVAVLFEAEVFVPERFLGPDSFFSQRIEELRKRFDELRKRLLLFSSFKSYPG